MRRGQIADVHIEASAGALAVALLGPRALGMGVRAVARMLLE